MRTLAVGQTWPRCIKIMAVNPKKIRIGIIGTGFGKSTQIPGFLACPDAEVIAVCSHSKEKAEATAKEFNIPHAFTDYRNLLALKELDLISIVTPPHLHHPMTMAALEARKHVLCEKPMALNLEEAREMYERAQAAEVVALIDHELRFNPIRRKIKELIEQNYIGRLRHVSVHMISNLRANATSPPWDWWSEAQKGGGALGAFGSHMIDLLRWWFGEITEVCGHLETFIRERPLPDSGKMRWVETEDFAAFGLKFANDAYGEVVLSSVARHSRYAKIELYGSEGTLILQDEKLLGGHKGEELKEVPEPEPLPQPKGTPEGVFPRSFALLAEYLIGCLRDGKRPQMGATFYDGMRCQAVIDAIRRSHLERRWVACEEQL